jgi:hypothetical protein
MLFDGKKRLLQTDPRMNVYARTKLTAKAVPGSNLKHRCEGKILQLSLRQTERLSSFYNLTQNRTITDSQMSFLSAHGQSTGTHPDVDVGKES